MTCDHVKLPGGGTAIVCSSRRRQRCKSCGRPAGLLCDWKVEGGTCDAPICDRCTFSPAKDKDLCPQHREAFRQWIARERAE